jgi:hypothetical protein
MTLTTLPRSRRSRLALALASIALVVAAGAAMFTAGDSKAAPAAAPSPSPSPSPSPFAVQMSPTPAPLPSPAAGPGQPKEPPRQQTLPIGSIAADPVRVHTGDGDCLNVRPQPGTSFQSDPRACLPEGFLLWLYGAPRQVDGETWRYALGEGWVAARYTVPDPAAKRGMGPFKSVTVMNSDWVDVVAGRVAAGGSTTELARVQNPLQGLGGIYGTISPSGRYLAFTREERYVPTLSLVDLETGATRKIPGVNTMGWGPGDRMSVTFSPNCPVSCAWYPAWMDPADGVVHKLSDGINDWWGSGWTPDGKSIVALGADRKLKRVALDGTATVIRELGANENVGVLVVSPDGTKLFSGTVSGANRVLDLKTGAFTEVPRAPQRQIFGGCGGPGFSGKLAAWIDDTTVAWHEAWGQKGYNGITIAKLGASERRVVPFFSLQSMALAAPGLLSFTTIEQMPDGGAFPLTWLLDLATGDARPVTVGADPAWAK